MRPATPEDVARIDLDMLPRPLQEATLRMIERGWAGPADFKASPMVRAWFDHPDDHPLFAEPQPAD